MRKREVEEKGMGEKKKLRYIMYKYKFPVMSVIIIPIYCIKKQFKEEKWVNSYMKCIF